MLTLKKLENQIKQLQEQIEMDQRQKTKINELEQILNKIRIYIKENPKNIIYINATDITDKYSIINAQTKGI